MKRPIGVTLLAVGAGIAGLFQIWRILVFLGIANFGFIGREVSFPDPQWGPALWALILAAMWFYIASGFWSVRAYAWSFGIFVSIFTLIFGFFAIIGSNSTTEAETIGWLLATAIFFYLNYPGVRNQFIENEMSRLTPEQLAAMEQLQAANAAAAAAARNPAPPAASAPSAPYAPPAAPAAPTPPPSDPGNPGS